MKTIFVDECKQGHYILSGHVVSDKDIPLLRKTLKSALNSGQRYFHFSKEKDGRRIQMLNTFKELHCEAIVIVCRRVAGKELRKTSLQNLIEVAETCGVERFVFDLDMSVKSVDDETFKLHNQKKGRAKKTKWDHVEYKDEPLLWVADGVGWAFNRKGVAMKLAKRLLIATVVC